MNRWWFKKSSFRSRVSFTCNCRSDMHSLEMNRRCFTREPSSTRFSTDTFISASSSSMRIEEVSHKFHLKFLLVPVIHIFIMWTHNKTNFSPVRILQGRFSRDSQQFHWILRVFHTGFLHFHFSKIQFFFTVFLFNPPKASKFKLVVQLFGWNSLLPLCLTWLS